MAEKLTADEVSPAALDAWLADRLDPHNAAELRRWVRAAGPWQDAYRASLSLWRRAGVPRYDLARSVSVAADDSEFAHARLVADMPLPHLGLGARREGRLGAEGTIWRLCDAGAAETRHVPYGTSSFEWDDDVLGHWVTELNEFHMDPTTLADDAMISIARLADGLQHPRAKSVALAVAEDLRAGAVHEGMKAAVRALDEAKLEADEEIQWASIALRTQLDLERLGHRLDDAEFDAAMTGAEQDLTPYAHGLLILDDDHYDDIIRGYDIDPESWWGLREKLDEEVPTAWVCAALEELAEEFG